MDTDEYDSFEDEDEAEDNNLIVASTSTARPTTRATASRTAAITMNARAPDVGGLVEQRHAVEDGDRSVDAFVPEQIPNRVSNMETSASPSTQASTAPLPTAYRSPTRTRESIASTTSSSTLTTTSALTTTTDAFAKGTMASSSNADTPSRPKRRKMDEESDSDSEGGSCSICMENWTNSGEHCISSLKCGHFFGQSCILRWLKGSTWCPVCKAKASKKDVRNHFVTKLKAIDTSEKDRALLDLERAQKALREAELKCTTLTLKVTLQQEEIDQLKLKIKQGLHHQIDAISNVGNQSGCKRWTYVKRLEICKKSSSNLSSEASATEQMCCRVMAYDPSNALLCISQPSFTVLAPGHGVRRVSLLEQKAGVFVPLHREAVRDLCFHPYRPELLLSASQDKCVRVTNVLSSQEVNRYSLEEEAWSCCWNLDNPHQFFVGTKRSQILLFDTREDSFNHLNGTVYLSQLTFPVMERRPIIGLVYVPKSNESPNEQPFGGLVVQTLGSIWFFEHLSTSDAYKPHKLDLNGPFWSLRFDLGSRLLMVSTKPNPCARHVICELRRVNMSESSRDEEEDFRVVANVLFDLNSNSSFLGRSFLRSLICAYPEDQDRVMIVYARGASANDQRLVVQQLGCEQVGQTITINSPVLDICCAFNVGSTPLLAVLTEYHVTLYSWQ